MTRPDYSGTLYHAQPPAPAQPQDAAVAAEQVADGARQPEPAIGSPADLWSTRASTSRGMIGRPASRAAATAAATTQVAALSAGAIPDSATRSVEIVPDPPRTGTVYGRRPGDRGAGTVLSARLPRLRIGWHSASPAALAMIGVSTPGIGLILGVDHRRQPVPIRFFRPEPTRITLVGGAWAAQLVLFRALALGANAIVRTDDPAAWQGVGERATGVRDRVTVNVDHPVRPSGTAQQPALFINDGDLIDAGAAADLGAWQTQMTILHEFDERGVPAVQDSDLVIMQRLGPGEAALAATALRLGGHSVQTLQQLDDDVVALLGSDAPQYARIGPTDIERSYAGSPRR